MNTQPPSRRRIGAFFGAKALRYERDAWIQERALSLLSEVVTGLGGPWGECVDLGCGVGLWSTVMERCGANGVSLGVDLAGDALKVNRTRHPATSVARADVERLPLRPRTWDMAVLASVLQWTGTPQIMLAEAARILKPAGRLAFTFFLEDSFGELANLRSGRGLAAAVLYATPDGYAELLRSCGLVLVDARVASGKRYFKSARAALKSISAVGATATAGRRLSRAELAELCDAYERTYRTPEGVPVSWSIMAGVASLD